MIDIEIDGKKISAEASATIIEIADQQGIYIPRFCYHKKLSIAANCRMCLVEVDKINKPQPACATPISPNMKVFTQSKMTLDAQRAVMEYLLINHPLDCPICDQGGECELQDLAMGYGLDHSSYEQNKRSVLEEDLGPLVATGMTRCIQCTRCVRFGEEIAGMPELGATGRGENMRIGTYVKHLMQSELSGNVIDICPVGALISKPYLFAARSWELRETPMIAPHDCLGSNIFVHSRGQEYLPQRIVMRVVPRENDAINENWLSDRDRFSYLGLEHHERILYPKIKRNGVWQDVSWKAAFAELIERLQTVIDKFGREQIAGLISPSATLEECYLFQKYLRALGTPHIDHRFRCQDFSDQHLISEYPQMSMEIGEISNLQAIFLLGADVRSEQPLLLHRINQAHKQGAKIMAINPCNYQYPFQLDEKIITTHLADALSQILAVLSADAGEHIQALEHVQASDTAKTMAMQLKKIGAKAGFFLGDYAFNHPEGALIRALVDGIAQFTGASLSVLTEGANSSGAWLAGVLPHRGPAGTKLDQCGEHARALLSDAVKSAYILLGTELEYDCSYPADALAALAQAELVICMQVFTTQKMLEYADIILPIAPFTENEGTFINIAGGWQSFPAATVPHGEAKPAWKVIKQLANYMQLNGFYYQSTRQIADEINQQVKNMSAYSSQTFALPATLPPVNENLMRLAPWPIYRTDALCRRSLALQKTVTKNMVAITLHPQTAAALQLREGENVMVKQGDEQIQLPLMFDSNLALNAVLMPLGLEETNGFGQASVAISIERIMS